MKVTQSCPALRSMDYRRRQWHSTPVLLPGKFHGWRSLVLYSPWNSPGQNTRVGSHSLLQGIFLTQGSNPGLPHCRRILYQLSHKESPFRGRYNNIPVSHVGLRRGNTLFMIKSPLTEPDKFQAAIQQQDTPGLRGLITV